MSKKEPLDEGDLDSLREMIKSYTSRTEHPITRKEVAALTEGERTSTAYYYALAQSMLLSWNAGKYYTTKEFDRLYAEMEKDGGRKVSKLLDDKNRITLAAMHAPVETDEGGRQYRLSRDVIVQTMEDIKIAEENNAKIESVLNESAR